uniref:Uncharacterized protein n=1 Tax=Zea mays TaxID=4577 RepID=B4FNX0_MAIZE|nr:unknown [Zea mays]
MPTPSACASPPPSQPRPWRRRRPPPTFPPWAPSWGSPQCSWVVAEKIGAAGFMLKEVVRCPAPRSSSSRSWSFGQ